MNGIHFVRKSLRVGDPIIVQNYNNDGSRNASGSLNELHLKTLFFQNPSTNTQTLTILMSGVIGGKAGTDAVLGGTIDLAPGDVFLLDAGPDGVINQTILVQGPLSPIEYIKVTYTYAHNQLKKTVG